MSESDRIRDRFEEHHVQLVEQFVENRDAVMDPNQDYEKNDFVAFARETLLPHADHEEELLYERVDEEVESEMATAALRRDHREIERRIDALEGTDVDGASLPLELHELSALVTHHFETEEEVVVRYLDDELSPEEFTGLLESILEHEA